MHDLFQRVGIIRVFAERDDGTQMQIDGTNNDDLMYAKLLRIFLFLRPLSFLHRFDWKKQQRREYPRKLKLDALSHQTFTKHWDQLLSSLNLFS